MTNLNQYHSQLEDACRLSSGLSEFRKQWSIFETNHAHVIFHDKKQVLLGMGLLQYVKENRTLIEFTDRQITSTDTNVVQRINDLFGQLDQSAKAQETIRVDSVTALMKALNALEAGL